MSEPGPDVVPLSGAFPLPFRVLFLSALGVLGWATNLHGLAAAGLDAPAALDLAAPPVLPPLGAAPPAHEPVYRLAAVCWAWALGTWAAFRLATGGAADAADAHKLLPGAALLGALALLFVPADVCRRRERDLFLIPGLRSALRRCVLPPRGRPIFFADVLLADVGTSFAKVLGDVWLSACMLAPSGSLNALPALQGVSRWVLPAIMSVPYAVRLRQCLIEYGAPANSSRRPLANALKYASAFPVIFLSAAQRIVAHDLAAERVAADRAWLVKHRIFSLWLAAAAVNSLYSFWWDVTYDWGLALLAPRARGPRSLPRPLVLPARHEKDGYPWGLRRALRLPLLVYPLLVFLDLVLRLTWSAKLSPHLHTSAGSLGLLWLELAEIARRWAWTFVRVEWEVVRRAEAAAAPRAPGEEYELVFADEVEREAE